MLRNRDIERLMKLSTISLVIWLAGFFALFQSFLNILAEVTTFGDRNFYDDWWNSPSVGTYWRTWNKPVYQFMKRHVFSPLVGRGWSPYSASVAVFTFSAILHELMVGVPTHNMIGRFKVWYLCCHLLTIFRRCIYRYDGTATTHCYHDAIRENERHKWQDHWKLYILGIFHPGWTTPRRVTLLLRMAS